MAPRHAERRHLHNIFIPNLSLGTKKKNSPRITRITRIWFDQSKRNKIVCENLCFLCHLPLNYFINSVCGDGAKHSRGLFPFTSSLENDKCSATGHSSLIQPCMFNVKVTVTCVNIAMHWQSDIKVTVTCRISKVKSLSPLTRLLAGVPVQEFTMPGIFTAKELSGGPAVRLTSTCVFPPVSCVVLSPPCYFVPLSLCSFAPLSCNKYFPRKTHNPSLVKT